MPELPEVEVLRRSLEPRLRGRRIADLWVGEPRLRERVDQAALRGAAVGQRIAGLDRRAKYLLLRLGGEEMVAIHLGMSGRLTLCPADAPRLPHEHLAFLIDGGERLRFVDPRRFGLVARLAGGLADPRLAGLGREPLEEGFDGDFLAAAARRRRGPVKPFLMDAAVVVGVGNIYASEALHRAGIHPARSVARISAMRWQRLAEAVREVLRVAIDHGGTTFSDFVDGAGQEGGNQLHLAVYDREGAPCPRCGRAVVRRVQAGRSTFYCPGCQR